MEGSPRQPHPRNQPAGLVFFLALATLIVAPLAHAALAPPFLAGNLWVSRAGSVAIIAPEDD